MENSTKNNELGYTQLQEMLPDYVFKRLSDKENVLFEATVTKYPDLLQEINDVKAVFNRTEIMNFDKSIDFRTRNLSIKVNERLRKKQYPKTGKFGLKYLVPALGLVILLIFIFPNKSVIKYPPIIKPTTTAQNTQQPLTGQKPQEPVVLKIPVIEPVKTLKKKANDDLATLDELDKINNIDISFVEDAIADDIISNSNEYKDFLINTQKDSYQELLQMVDTMNETDIQTIIKELENADV